MQSNGLQYRTAPPRGSEPFWITPGPEPVWIESRAISSGVERHVDIVEVGGSRPPSPTNSCKMPDFFTKIGLPRLYPALGLYRIAFPHVLRRLWPARCWDNVEFLEDLGIAVTKRVRRNEEIEATEVRVIDSQGEQAGVMGLRRGD